MKKVCRAMGVTKNEKKVALQTMLDFVEGRITINKFWAIFKEKETIREILTNDKTRPKGVYKYLPNIHAYGLDKTIYSDSVLFYSPENILKNFDIEKLEARVALFKLVAEYFRRHHKKFCKMSRDLDMYNFFQDIQPEWLDIRDEQFLYRVVASAPANLSRNELLEWGKNRILEMFHYKKKPPEWMQNPTWPIVDNRPLEFVRQETIESDCFHEKYYFYDSITKHEVVIEQTT